MERGGRLGTTERARWELWLLWLCRVSLAVVFLTASLEKIAHPAEFARAVSNYRILPAVAVNLFSLVLPWVELLCGLLLLAGQWTRSAGLLAALLFFLFFLAVSTTLVRGLDIHCGCFDTTAGRKVGVQLLLEDSLWLLMSCVLAFRADDRWGWRQLLGPLALSRGKEARHAGRRGQAPGS